MLLETTHVEKPVGRTPRDLQRKGLREDEPLAAKCRWHSSSHHGQCATPAPEHTARVMDSTRPQHQRVRHASRTARDPSAPVAFREHSTEAPDVTDKAEDGRQTGENNLPESSER